MSDSDDIELTPKEKFYLEQKILEDNPYPEMMDYFKRIANKLLNNPNVNEISLINKRNGEKILNEEGKPMHLSDFAGKVNFMFSNDKDAAFIFASNSNGEPVRVNEDTNINDLNWNIVLNPLWLVELFEEKGETFTEDHLATVIGHELSHMWNRIDGTACGSLYDGKTDEEEADIRGMDLLTMAGYNPGVCSKVYEKFSASPIDPLSIILDPHLDSQTRKEVLNLVAIKLTREQGTNYSSKLERKLTTIDPVVLDCVNKEKAVHAIQREMDDFMRLNVKPLISTASYYNDYGLHESDEIYESNKLRSFMEEFLDASFVPDYVKEKIKEEVGEEYQTLLRQYEDSLKEYNEIMKHGKKTLEPWIERLNAFRFKVLKAEEIEFAKLRAADTTSKTIAEEKYMQQKQRVFEEFDEIEPNRKDVRELMKRLKDFDDGTLSAFALDNAFNYYYYQAIYCFNEYVKNYSEGFRPEFEIPLEERYKFLELCSNTVGCSGLIYTINSKKFVNLDKRDSFDKKAEELKKYVEKIKNEYYEQANRSKIIRSREFLGSIYNDIDSDEMILGLYPLVKNLRENFNDVNLLKYASYDYDCEYVSSEVKKNEIKHCYEKNGKLARSSTSTDEDYAAAELLVLLATQKPDDVGKEVLEKAFLFKKITNDVSSELLYSSLPIILINRNNYPYDFDDCLTLYKSIEYERLNTTDITTVQSELLKRFLTQENDDEIIKNSLFLLDKKYRFTNDVLREKLLGAFSDAVLRKYGKDDGSKAYKEKIYDFICELKECDMAQFDRRNIARKISDKLETKRYLSEMFYDFSEGKSDNMETEIALNAGALVQRFIRYIADDQIIDFLQNDFSYQKALGLQESILKALNRKSNPWEMIKQVKEKFVSEAYQLHALYWGCSLDERAAILSQVLSDERKKDTEGLFKYAISRVLPPNMENREMIEDILFAYINAHEEDKRMFYVAALMAANKQSAVQVGNFNIGKPLKDFLENIGPAGIKLGQAIGSYPGTPAEIVASMQELKQDADPPTRWELYKNIDIANISDKRVLFDLLNGLAVGEKLDTYVNLGRDLDQERAERIKDFWGKGRDGLKDDDPDEVAKIGKVIGSGSYFITVDSDGRVLQVLRPYAAERAYYEFDILSKALETLPEKYSLFVASAKQIIGTAQNMVGIETDMGIAKEQIKTAEELYPKESTSITVNGKRYSCLFKVAKWIEGGLDYKTVEKVNGLHFNDMPSSPLKTEIAKLYLRQELKNIMSGGKFDHDRHGAQIKIDVDKKNSTITLGIFDNGAMSVEAPDEVSKRSLSEVFNMTIDMATASFMRDRKVDVVNAFTTAVTEYVNKQEKTVSGKISESDQKSRDYILSVQRGLLALNDFMRDVDQIDLLSLFVEAFANADKDILGSMSGDRKYLLKGSAPIIKGYANLNNIYVGLHKKVEGFTKRLQGQEAKVSSAPVETALDKDIREINELEDVYFNLMSPKEAKDIGLYRDINGNLHNINNIPEGTVFDELDLSGMDFTELPDLSKCAIKKLIIRDCKNLTSLKNLPNYIKEIDCSGCSSLTSLEGCPKGVKRINCTCCHHLIYIPDYIPDDAIEGISEGVIIQLKSNWIGKNKETILDTVKEQSLPKETLTDKLRYTLKPKEPKATEAEYIGFCIDIKGKVHDINNIPDGTVFDELDLSGMDFTELPDLSKCVIKKLIIRDCKNLTSLKNLPNYIEEIDCSGCSSLTSLEGCPKVVKKIDCTDCNHLIYIPDYIPDDAIEGISEGGIIQLKSNWIGKNKKMISDTAKEQPLSKEGLAGKLRYTLKSKGPKAAFNLFKKINKEEKGSSIVIEINTPSSPAKGNKKSSLKNLVSLRKKSNRDA